MPGCDVFWQRRGDAFLGYMKPGACTFQSQRSGKTIIVSDDLYLDDEGSANPERAASYAWANPGATRIGINLRWVQASCSRQP